MNSGHPEEAVSQGELLVMVSGSSIELKALWGRLESRGARLLALPVELDADPNGPLPRLVICDLASDGALGPVEIFYARSADAPGTPLVALGSPRGALSDGASALLGRARRFRRPLDVQAIAEELLSLLRHPPRASTRVPQSQTGRSLLPLKPRSSQVPKLSSPPREGTPDSAPSSHPSSPVREEPGAQPSRQLASPAAEHSVVSPELETLLAEAERRVQAQISMQGEGLTSNPPEAVTAHLSDDVWDALGEELEDDAENPVPDALSDPAPSPSPLALEPPEPSLPPPAAGDSTMPPGRWQPDLVNDDTGSFAPIPESEKTSGSQPPMTAAGRSLAPSPGTFPGATRASLAHGGEEDPPESEPDGLLESARPIPPTSPPSTSPPQRRPISEARPATIPALALPKSPPAVPASAPPPSLDPPPSEQGQGTLSLEDERALEAESPEPLAPAPGEARSARAPAPVPRTPAPQLELPHALVRGGAPLVMGRAVRQRFSGCLAFEVDQGLRRVVFKDGDVVIAASAVHGESLVAFLAQRGDLSADTAAQIEHRIPTFGRHAGAALIARGLLEQGDLWPVLRAHSEWVLAQVCLIERGTVQVEDPVPERLAAEPAVFGGATGAEVLVEVIERAISPARALEHLGDLGGKLAPGAGFGLLGECALSAELARWVAEAQHRSLEQLLAEASAEPILPCVLYALTLLEVLRKVEEQPATAARGSKLRPAAAPDRLDDDAVRAKVLARRALVDEGDYFALLGVPRQATGYDIRRSYVELRRQFDPGQVLRQSTLDLAEDVDTILEVIDEAYEILRDQARRERYRRAIESSPG